MGNTDNNPTESLGTSDNINTPPASVSSVLVNNNSLSEIPNKSSAACAMEEEPVAGPSSRGVSRSPSVESKPPDEDEIISQQPEGKRGRVPVPSSPPPRPPPPKYSSLALPVDKLPESTVDQKASLSNEDNDDNFSEVRSPPSPPQQPLNLQPTEEDDQIPIPSSENSIKKSSSTPYLPMELYVTLISSFSFLCIGLMRSYTSPAITSMYEDTEFFSGTSGGLSKSVISWVAASPPLASFFGTILSGLSLQYCGRQKTLILLTLPYILGWFLIGFARNVPMIMTGRALTGLAAGFATATAQLYVSECVRAKVRGFLGFLPAMMLSFGILLGFAMSTINLNWQELALLMTCFPILLLLFTITLPESPSWLMYRGKEKEAIESLVKLRGVTTTSENNKKHQKTSNKDDDGSTIPSSGSYSNNKSIIVINDEIEKELNEMRRVIRKRRAADSLETGDVSNKTATDTNLPGGGDSTTTSPSEPQDFIQFVFTDLLGKREIWFPAFVSLSLMVFQQFTGANAIIYYLSLILKEAEPTNHNMNLIAFFETQNNQSHGGGGHGGGPSGIGRTHPHGLNANVSSVIVGLVQFFAFFLSLPMIDRLGRRALLITSALLMIFPHLVLGIYFYMKLHPEVTITVHVYSWSFLDMVKLSSDWLPLLCLCAFIAAYSIGFGPVPFIIMSEVFPSSCRSYMCALASLVNHLTLFFIVRVFPTLMDWFGMEIMFWMFAVFCLLAAIHVAIVVPETKGKTLAEIELEFMGRRNSNDSQISNDSNVDDDHRQSQTKSRNKISSKNSVTQSVKDGNRQSSNKTVKEKQCQCNCKH